MAAVATIGVALALQSVSTPASAQTFGCGTLENPFGPYDYRTARTEDKHNVESNHFSPAVEYLQEGITGRIGGDIDYTLRAFPNHPRALWAMVRLSEREKRPRPLGAKFTVECYFDRAIRFRPEDGEVRLIYALYLTKIGDKKGAVRELEQAAQFSEGNAAVHYNLGLAYLDLGQYAKSLEQAKKAYALSFPLPGLRDRLKRSGHWQD